MRVILFQFIWLLALLLPAEALDSVSPPDPAKLSADWWSYFSPGEPIDVQDLEARIDTFLGTLEEARKMDEFGELVRRIGAGLGQYLDVVGLPSPSPVYEPLSTGPINLDEAIEDFKRARQLEVEVRSAFEELAWQKSLIDQDRKRQSLARARYLETSAGDPNRFASGLSLMAGRTLLEARTFEHSRRKERAERERQRHSQLAVHLESLSSRVEPDASSLQRWSVRKKAAEDALNRVRGRGSEGEPSGIMESRQALLTDLQEELEISLAEDRLFRSKIALAWAEAFGSEVKPGKREAAQTVLVEFRSWAAKQTDIRERASESARRIRTAVSEQLAEAGGNEETTALLREILDSAEVTDQLERRLESELSVTVFVSGLLDKENDTGRGWIGSLASRTFGVVARASEEVGRILNFPLFEINETPVTIIGILRIFFIVFVALWVSRLVRRALQKFGGLFGNFSGKWVPG